ncbi:MAG: hypothetical protein AAGC71_03815 [Pseudomonadota bacterium]
MTNIALFIVVFALDALLGALFLWIGMRITARLYGMPPGATYCGFRDLVIVVAAAALVALLPGWIGVVLSWIVLFGLLRHFTEAEIGELLLMVIISRVGVALATAMLMPLLLQIA